MRKEKYLPFFVLGDKVSNWYASQKTIERKTGRPYLYYKIENAKGSIPSINMGVARDILKEQGALFYGRFNARNNTSLSKKEVDEILKDWVSDTGIIGQKIDRAMQQMVFDDQGEFKYGTSGGVAVGENISLSEAKSVFNTSKKKALASCSQIINGVDGAIEKILKVLEANGESVLVKAIVNQYYSGGRKVPERIRFLVHDGNIERELIQKSDTKLVTTIKTLNEAIVALEALGKHGQSKKAGEVRSEYGKLIGVIQSCFNSIGGTVHEVAVAHAVNVAADVGNKAIKKTEKQIKNLVAGTNGSFYSQWSAQEGGTDGKESKDDVTFTYNKNGLIVDFGGTVKLRQSKAFRGSGAGSQTLGVKGLIARGETYDSITKKLEKYSPGVNQYGYQLLGAWGEDRSGVPGTDNVQGDWWKIKQLAGALTLVDSLSGTGAIGDFSALLIVNNKIFSIADILQKIIEDVPTQLMGSGVNRFFEVDFSYKSLLNKVQGQAASNKHNKFLEALDRNKFTYSTLQQAKIKITLNLGHIYGPDIFK